MKIEQINKVQKVIGILKNADVISKIYSIDFNNDEFKIYTSFDRAIAKYCKAKKYKYEVLDSGSIWFKKTIGGVNILIVLW